MCISSQIIESNLVKYNDVDKENREKVVWKRVDWIRKKVSWCVDMDTIKKNNNIQTSNGWLTKLADKIKNKWLKK